MTDPRFRRFTNASTGLAKNRLPKREKVRSNGALGNWAVAESARAKWLLLTKAALARFVYAIVRSGKISIPPTLPSGATVSAITIVLVPPPQPTSSTRSPGLVVCLFEKNCTDRCNQSFKLMGASEVFTPFPLPNLLPRSRLPHSPCRQS